MRKAVIIGLLALVLGGIFYFFVMRSPTQLDVAELTPRATTQKIVPTTIAALDSNVPVGRSNDASAQSLDSKTQRVLSEFSSEDVAPRPDGSVDVIRPRARFYGRNNGIVTLEGSSGHILYTQAGERGDSKSLGTSTPTSGELHEVTIKFYEKTLEEEPSITVTVPAVRFDANSNRITTIDCVVDGQGYAAEQVPVTMRGREFDFDGQGLSVAWNDREEMLDQLEILKGNRLVVRDISKFMGSEIVMARPSPRPAPSLEAALFGIVMVQAPEPEARKGLYYATFDRDVHVLKNGEEVASGDQMRCVIPLGEGMNKSEPSTAPTTKKHGARREATARTTATAPATAPTTQPQSLEIRWSGKLLIRPAKAVAKVPQTEMVELIGNPARVSQKDTYATGRLIRVEPEAGRVRIEPGGNVRTIEVKDPSGAELRSRNPLVIDEAAGLVSIEGSGALTVPPSQDQKGPLRVTWDERFSISLAKEKPAFLRSILIEGQAKVDSESLKLKSSTLEMAFDAPQATSPAEKTSRFSMPSPDLALLRTVHARGDASCEVGTDAAVRTLAAQDIQLGFEAGDKDALLTSILCDGEVALVDGEKLHLEAGSLNVQTQPISLSKGDAGLGGDFFEMVKSLDAQRSVKIKRADGSSVDGEELQLSGSGPAQRLVVSGAPAILQSTKGSLQGGRIELDPATGDVRVPTAGSFAGTNPDRPGTDVSIGWEESMNVVGKTGATEFQGDVKISGHDDKGSELLARSRHGTAQFTVAENTTQPAEPGLAGIRFESIRSLTLDGGVNLAVTTTDARSSSMETEKLEIDLAKGHLLAPQNGRMLVVDQRKDPQTGKNSFGPGALAMLWKDSLDWDMRGGNLALVGGVRIGFEREGSNDPVRINCDRLTGILTPIETSNGFDQMTPRVDLKMLKAQGNVTVRSKDAKFDAAELLYDLQSQLASAQGTDTTPVEVYDATGSSRIGFSTITWNLRTGMLEDFRDITGQIRR